MNWQPALDRILGLIRKAQSYYVKKPTRRAKYRQRYRQGHQRHNLSFTAGIDRIADQLEAYKEQQEASERRRRAREIWTITGLFTAAAFAALQWGVFKEQAADFRDQERRQLRAYLGTTEMQFSCGDCLPTKDDRLEAITNNYGQTPATVLYGIVWYTEFLFHEEFPEAISKRPSAIQQFAPRSVVIYPHVQNKMQFPVTDEQSLLFWEAKKW
jgi:hypothetical protein